MNSFERFRQRNSLRMVAENNINGSFICNGYPSAKIEKDGEPGTICQAAVVNKHEQDLVYVYTKTENPLDLGSVWGVKGLNFLIAEEVIIIKDVSWHKYKALKCNVDIDGFKGFFYGPKKSHIDTDLKKEFLVFSSQEPVLALASNCGLKIGDRIVIGDRGWKIIESDAISTKGITYFSLVAATISKEVTESGAFVEGKEEVKLDNYTKDPIITVDNIIYTNANEEITLESIGGYLSFGNSAPITITNRTRTTVTLKMSFGAKEVRVKRKISDSQIEEIIIRERR